MNNYQYISIPISFLEKQNISKENFMQDSAESKDLLAKIFTGLPLYIEVKNTFLINSSFILVLGNKQDIVFDDAKNFSMFCDFIKDTDWKNFIDIDVNKKEISISKDIPLIFYNILYEFLV